MKKKTGKRIRHGRLAGMLLIVGLLAVAVHGSFAAYTSFNKVKRVVSTGTQSDTMFDSNYLSLMDLDDTSYPVKRISLSENGENYTFTVQICNYPLGTDNRYNPRDITYNITAQLFSVDGGSLPEAVTSVRMNDTAFATDGTCLFSGQKLVSGSAKKAEYKLEIPTKLKNQVKLQIVAEPSNDSSKEAVNSQKLAAILSFADYEVTKNWTGHFIDSKEKAPDQYDAFNYEISGNGTGTVTVTWSDSLLLSKWAANDGQVSSPYQFTVDGTTTAIQFQFYRNPEKLSELEGKNWTELEKFVQVTFQEN